MNELEYNALREASWRRRLTADEEVQLHAYLAGHPDDRLDWEEEFVLTTALRQMPDAPLSSNFTALVMQDIGREDRTATRRDPTSLDWWRHFWPRVAVAAVSVAVAVATFLQFGSNRLGREIAPMAGVMAAIPQPELFQDFEEINQMRFVAAVSDEALIEFLR